MDFAGFSASSRTVESFKGNESRGTDPNAGDGGDKGKLKAPRVVRACDACRRKKIRCLGGSTEEPCSHCHAQSIPCLFEERAIKRGPARGYIESLEKRLEAMEALLRNLPGVSAGEELSAMNKEAADFGGDDNSPRTSSGSRPSEFSPTPPKAPVIDQLAVDLDELTIDKDRYVGRGSGLHLAMSIREFSSTEANTNIAHDADPSLVEVLLQQAHMKKSNLFPIPPPDLSDRLVSAYFELINSGAPLLHRPSFERALAGGLLDSDTSFRSLYFMVCAVAARFVDDDRMQPPLLEEHPVGAKQSRGYQFFRASAGAASPHLASATLFDLQTACLAIQWLMGCSSPISAWSSVGYAIRRAVDVGAHRENRSRWKASPLEDQLRKRSFFFLVGLDRYISSGLGRPLAIQDTDIDVTPPLSLTDYALDEWNLLATVGTAPVPPPPPSDVPTAISGCNAWISLQYILGRTMSRLYGLNRTLDARTATEAVSTLDCLLDNWLNTVPVHLRWDPLQPNMEWFSQSAALYATYYCSQILIHRDFLSPKRANLHPFPSLAICSNAARSCAQVLDTLRERGALGPAFFYAPLSAVQSGLILLINVFSDGQPERRLTSSAMRDVKKCMRVLAALSESTFIASKCLAGLIKLANLVVAAPAAPRDLNAPSLKRPNTEDWLDTDSPGSSSLDSSGASPEAGGAGDDTGGHRNSRFKYDQLPLTREDLSLPTFNGRVTFTTNERPAQPDAMYDHYASRQQTLRTNPVLQTWPRDDNEARAALAAAVSAGTAPMQSTIAPVAVPSPYDYQPIDKVTSPPLTSASAAGDTFGLGGFMEASAPAPVLDFGPFDLGLPQSDFAGWENAFGDTMGMSFDFGSALGESGVNSKQYGMMDFDQLNSGLFGSLTT